MTILISQGKGKVYGEGVEDVGVGPSAFLFP